MNLPLQTFTHTLKTVSATTALFLGLLLTRGYSQVQLTEDFESYADQTALNAAWGTTLTTLSFTTTNRSTPSGAKSIAQDNSSTLTESVYKALGAAVPSTSMYFRFYFYDSGAARSFGRVEAHAGGTISGSLQQQVSIGRYNNIVGSKYYGRVALGAGTPTDGGTTPNATWFQLGGAANTSSGWHKAEIVGGTVPGTSTVRYRFYIDGTLGASCTDSSSRQFNFALFGSGLTSTGGAQWYDNAVVEALQMIPQIVTQPPVTTNVNELQPVTLRVVATNSTPTNVYALNTLTYQWQFNDVNIAGATASAYSIANARLTNSGNYRCIVSDAYGSQSVTSDESSLNVDAIQAPVVDVGPSSQVVNLGDNAAFTVTAHGGGTLYYTWRLYGTNVSFTGTDNNFSLTGVTSAQAGPYTVVVTNDLGSTPATSAVAFLTVNLPPSLTSATNQTVVIGTKAAIRMRATDDLSSESILFQTFETNSLGSHVMFSYPGFSGSTGANVDTNLPDYCVITNNYPTGHGGSRVLTAVWTYLNGNSVRFTTASSGVSISASPIISYTNHLRFDICTDRDLKVGLGVRDASPTGPIGATDNGSGNIEWIGVSGSVPSRTVSANAWTTLDFDPTSDPVQNAYGAGNGVLDSTTGKGVLEHLYLVPGDGQPNPYTMYVDNFLVVANNGITFSLLDGPADATIDPYSGIITWAPSILGPTNFTVSATDFYGLSTTNSFVLTVVNPAATIVLNTPTNNQSFTAPATIPLSATVTTNNNTIDYVGFFNGTTWTYVTNSPYTASLTGVGAGSYPISATVFYGGNSSSSSTNHVTVVAPQLPNSSVNFSSGNVVISGNGSGGTQTFVLYMTSDLAAPVAWLPVQTNGPGTAYSFNIPVNSGPKGYFRVGAY